MSIIIGFAASNCGLVASDGRHFLNGKLMKEDNAPEAYDKTFKLIDGKLIGAVSGTMELQGRKIGKHLEELLSTECKVETSKEKIIKCLYKNLATRLQNIPNEEIGFQFRKVDLILITSITGNIKDLRIFVSRFHPNQDNTSITYEEDIIVPENKGLVYWKMFGDDAAQKSIGDFLNEEIKKLPMVNEKTLRSISYKAIRHGIKNCSKHQNGEDFTCGGKPFVNSIE